SLCGVTGFAAIPSHNVVCARLGEVATDPLPEIIEYLKRDIANIVLRNKDNHARNPAIRRDAQGRIGLTPLFDFAPMWLHPDGIA
ncbi:HipA domain-containing protein, partial [Acinetobacter baumannii]